MLRCSGLCNGTTQRFGTAAQEGTASAFADAVRQSVNSDAGVDPLQAGYDADEPRHEGVGGRCAEADAERGGASDDAYPSDFALSRAMASFTAR